MTVVQIGYEKMRHLPLGSYMYIICKTVMHVAQAPEFLSIKSLLYISDGMYPLYIIIYRFRGLLLFIESTHA